MKTVIFGISDFPFGKKALGDERLAKMRDLYHSKKTTPIQVEFVSEEQLKAADVIVCCDDKKLDLLLLDMEVAERRLEGVSDEAEKALLLRAQETLEKETPLNQGGFSEEELGCFRKHNFITIRPIVFIAKQEMEDLPLLGKKVYARAGRISFLTGGPKECRAWEVRDGATALDAAACIHSDIARGFIRAEVMAFDDLVRAGHVQKAKSEGCLRQEGKTYLIKDGDVIEFKFSV